MSFSQSKHIDEYIKETLDFKVSFVHFNNYEDIYISENIFAYI